MGTIEFTVDGRYGTEEGLNLVWEGTCTSITNLTDGRVIEVPKDAQSITITDFSNIARSVIVFSGDITSIDYVTGAVTGMDIRNMSNLEKIEIRCHSYLQVFALRGENNIVDARGMLAHCGNLRIVHELNLCNCIDATELFMDCRSLTDIYNVTAGRLLYTTRMFYSCELLPIAPDFDMSTVVDAAYMFMMCTSLAMVPLYNMGKVKNLSRAFKECYNLRSIPEFDTSNVENMEGVCCCCYSITNIPLLNTSKVKYFSDAFASCYKLSYIPLLDTSNGETMRAMFYKIPESTNIPELSIDKATDLDDIYIGGALREPIGDTLQYKEKSKRMLIGDSITQLFKDVYPESPKKRDIFAGFHKPDEDK